MSDDLLGALAKRREKLDQDLELQDSSYNPHEQGGYVCERALFMLSRHEFKDVHSYCALHTMFFPFEYEPKHQPRPLIFNLTNTHIRITCIWLQIFK
jgi:hypothetical protein